MLRFSIFGYTVSIKKDSERVRKDDINNIFALDEKKHAQAVAQVEKDYDLESIRARAQQFNASIS